MASQKASHQGTKASRLEISEKAPDRLLEPLAKNFGFIYIKDQQMGCSLLDFANKDQQMGCSLLDFANNLMLDLGKNDDWATKTVEFINELWHLTKKNKLGIHAPKFKS
jgi:hypothetical protein